MFKRRHGSADILPFFNSKQHHVGPDIKKRFQDLLRDGKDISKYKGYYVSYCVIPPSDLSPGVCLRAAYTSKKSEKSLKKLYLGKSVKMGYNEGKIRVFSEKHIPDKLHPALFASESDLQAPEGEQWARSPAGNHATIVMVESAPLRASGQ